MTLWVSGGPPRRVCLEPTTIDLGHRRAPSNGRDEVGSAEVERHMKGRRSTEERRFNWAYSAGEVWETSWRK